MQLLNCFNVERIYESRERTLSLESFKSVKSFTRKMHVIGTLSDFAEKGALTCLSLADAYDPTRIFGGNDPSKCDSEWTKGIIEEYLKTVRKFKRNRIHRFNEPQAASFRLNAIGHNMFQVARQVMRRQRPRKRKPLKAGASKNLHAVFNCALCFKTLGCRA